MEVRLPFVLSFLRSLSLCSHFCIMLATTSSPCLTNVSRLLKHVPVSHGVQGHCFDTMSLLRLTLLRLGNVGPISVCLNARPKMAPGAAWPLYPLCIYMFALLRCRLLLVELLTLTACLPTTNKHDIEQNTALAIVRTSVPRETPMALKLSAAIVIVESERILPLRLGHTHRPSIFAPLRVYPITTQIPKALLMSIFVLHV